MTEKTLKRLEADANAATPGKWTRTTSDPHWLREVRDAKGRPVAWCGNSAEKQAHADSRYIAGMGPAVALQLVAEIRRLRALVEKATSEP